MTGLENFPFTGYRLRHKTSGETYLAISMRPQVAANAVAEQFGCDVLMLELIEHGDGVLHEAERLGATRLHPKKVAS